MIAILMLIGSTDLIAQYNPTDRKLHLQRDSVLTIFSGQRPLLQYNFNIVDPPPAVDDRFKRSGFVHPIYTMAGSRLTQIHPKDHYHHFGVWNPWTQTIFEGDTVDFWNLAKNQGTVRFSGFLDVLSNDDTVQYRVKHEHVVFKKDRREVVALNEVQTVRVYCPDMYKNYYLVDIDIELTCGTSQPIKLLKYRYGGLGWRATEFWDAENSNLLTSEGHTRDNADGTRGRWCIVQGELPDTRYGGMAILTHKSNFNYPEPIRTWDSRANGGVNNVFVNISPTKDRVWELLPEHIYLQRYRLIVFDGPIDRNQVEELWYRFVTNN